MDWSDWLNELSECMGVRSEVVAMTAFLFARSINC